MSTVSTPAPEPNPIFPWAQGIYKPRGNRVYYYPDDSPRILHAEMANNSEAYQLACKLNEQTREHVRQFVLQPDATVTPETLKAEYEGLDKQIGDKVDAYVVSAKKAAGDFDAMVPLLDRMQAMLSQRGKLRELMDTAKLPTWTAWFEQFRKRMQYEVTLRAVQYKLRAYREPDKRERKQGSLHLDRSFLKQA